MAEAKGLLAPRPVNILPGVGPVFGRTLRSDGFATVGAFAIVTLVRRSGAEATSFAAWSGLGRRDPLLESVHVRRVHRLCHYPKYNIEDLKFFQLYQLNLDEPPMLLKVQKEHDTQSNLGFVALKAR